MHKLIFTFLLLNIIFPYSNNPPNAKTGAPEEGTCRDCHSSFALNSGTGDVEILELPEVVISGETYPIQVKVSHPVLQRWGFEIAAKFSDNTQAGTFTITDNTHTTSGVQNGITYIKQRSAGTFVGQSESATWEMDWTAPAIFPSDITFYAAGVTASNSNGNSQDYVYTTFLSTTEGEECDLGDINDDGALNILDVVIIVNCILDECDGWECADVNEDGILNILDIVTLVNIILSN